MVCSHLFWLQVNVDEWKVEVQEGERAQDLLKQQQDTTHLATATRCLLDIPEPTHPHKWQ